jgi:hypothetical protein
MNDIRRLAYSLTYLSTGYCKGVYKEEIHIKGYCIKSFINT